MMLYELILYMKSLQPKFSMILRFLLYTRSLDHFNVFKLMEAEIRIISKSNGPSFLEEPC